MLRGFRLGSVAGFEIRVDYSWLLLFSLIFWTLSTDLFPFNYPNLEGGTYFVMGLVGAILFFVSLLLHELSHSVVARAKGIPVEGITLFLFGGVAQTRMDAEEPGDEFQIAGVGPLTSLALAGIFGLAWYVGQQAGWSPAVNGLTAYLSWVNTILAVFNLLPGFPLDGGRLFRSVVWRITGDIRKATRVASIGGRIVGTGLIVWGFWQLFSPVPNFIGGLWLVLIGWFLNRSAESGYQDLVVRQMLQGARAREMMTLNPETISADATLQTLMDEYLFNRNYRSFPVVEGDRPIGLITFDAVKQVPREQWSQTSVRESMTRIEDGIVVGPDEDAESVLEKMQETRMRRLLVAKGDRLEGILSSTDIANWLQRKREFGEVTPQRRPMMSKAARETRAREA